MTRLLARRRRAVLISWLLLLIALCGGTAYAYQNTYDTAAQRRTAVELAQQNQATTLLYGRLPDPGTPAQMFAWELGAIVTILAAVMAVLIAVSVTRDVEDDGSLELLRGCGVAPRRPLRGALTLLTGVAIMLAAGCGAAVGLASGHVDGVTWAGALLFGLTVGLTFLLVAAVAVVLAQIAPSGGQARLLGLAATGLAFALRAIADTKGVDALNWVSPLGLRATVLPFTAGRWWALAPPAAAAVLLAILAVRLSDRREFGAGLIRRPGTRDSRLTLRTPIGLAARLGRSVLLAWTIGVAAIGTLFSSMGSGTVRHSRESDIGGFLGAQLGAGDPAAAYLAYSGTVVGIVVSAYAVLSVLATARSEDRGLTDLILTTGVRRWAPAAAQVLVTAGGCGVILLATGVLGALITPASIAGDHVALRAFAYAVGQWPSAVAAAGYAGLVVGISPRLAGLAWLPVLASAFLALLGPLLKVPRRVQGLGFFRHVPDLAGGDPWNGALLVLIGLGVLLALLGALATARRDIMAA
jgi:ABC-2 type transport system permease protein